MEAPEKIYIHVKGDKVTNTWNSEWIGVHDVEYTRTDAFFEKACEFIKERLFFDDNAWHIEGEVTIKDKVIEDFKNYMKG